MHGVYRRASKQANPYNAPLALEGEVVANMHLITSPASRCRFSETPMQILALQVRPDC